MEICSRCIQPLNRPNLTVNKEGVCGACQWEDEKLKIDWHNRQNELKILNCVNLYCYKSVT